MGEKKTSQAQIMYTERYQDANIRRYTVKLNRKYEGEMIAYLEGKKPQSVFKMALKEYMEKH